MRRTGRGSILLPTIFCLLFLAGCGDGGGDGSSGENNGGETTSDTIPPSQPTGLTATAISSSQINLHWTASTDNVGVTRYEINRGGIHLQSVTITSASDNGLSPSTQYCYIVYALDAAANRSSAAVTCAVTLAAKTAPPAPTGIDAVAGDEQVTISWNPVAGATNYNLYWNTTSPVTKATGFKIADVTSPYIHTGRTNGVTYYYVVTAVNANGESAESAQVSATPTASAGLIQLPKTGQTTCYNASGDVIACAGTGQDGEIQAGVAWPSPRFTDNGNGTVTDNLTGLMWLKDANCFGSRNWQNALDTVADFNTNPGKYNCPGYTTSYTDWRLPNVNELESLFNAGEATNTATWLNSQGFTNVQGSYFYWSSTTVSETRAWTVYMRGEVTDGNFKSFFTGNGYTWPVRAGQTDGNPNSIYPANLWKTGQRTCYNASGDVIACAGTGQDGEIQAGVAWPSPRSTDNGNGTVTDNLTGLMWLKDANCFGLRRWLNALDAVSDFNATPTNYNCLGYDESNSPYTDWRPPNRKELYSLKFSGWSSTTSGNIITSTFNNTVQAWIGDGGEVDFDSKSNYNVIRPVRGGQ